MANRTEQRDLLRRTPELLSAWLRPLPESLLHANEGPDTFSPFDVVGHLIQGERHDWLVRARHILAGNEEPFAPFDRFAHVADSRGKSIDERLDTFAALRRANLAELDALDPSAEDLLRSGRHPALGPVTLGQLLATWVVHDQGHVAQIARVLAKQWREEVGPWRAYLPVLDDRPRG